MSNTSTLCRDMESIDAKKQQPLANLTLQTLIRLRNNSHGHIIRNRRPARRIDQARNLNRAHESLTRESDLDGEEHVHVPSRDGKLQRSRGVSEVRSRAHIP